VATGIRILSGSRTTNCCRLAIRHSVDCRPLSEAEGGKLFDLDRYINFFARPGGVKADPSDVILASIAVPPTPLTTTLTMPCADATCGDSFPQTLDNLAQKIIARLQ
jgi:hypothetical protein